MAIPDALGGQLAALDQTHHGPDDSPEGRRPLVTSVMRAMVPRRALPPCSA